MSPDRWRRIEALYHSALERESKQRAAFLAEACSNDTTLRHEVESLLSQERSPIDEPPWKAASELLSTNSTARLRSGTRLGPYEAIELVGEGGMGSVYRARDTRLDRIVAVKLIQCESTDRMDLRQRFRREARAISAINHPHVCALYDVGEQDGIDYLVMEYVEGETLAQRLRKGKLPMDRVLHYGGQIAQALAIAHAHGIIHRDLKPGN